MGVNRSRVNSVRPKILVFLASCVIVILSTSMSSKSSPLELSRNPSLTVRLLFHLNNLWLRVWFKVGLVILALVGCVLVELHTSFLQSWLFSYINRRVFHEVGQGRSSHIVFPRAAPLDARRGYSKLPAIQARLEAQGFRVTQQASQSSAMVELLNRGISPPYVEPSDTGIDIRGTEGKPLFRYGQSDFLFQKIEETPPLLVKTLLFLENRDLEQVNAPRQNPAIEWDRLLKAALLYVGSKLYLPLPVQGGSTLAVQLEKYRHSPNGRTGSPVEKLRQVFGASLKAYRAGVETRAWRDRIIVDYLNTVPLAAAPGYGEIHGVGEGLYAWFGIPLEEIVNAFKSEKTTPAKVRAFKHVLALLIAVRAPTVYLVEDHAALEEKVAQYTRLLAKAKIIDPDLAAALETTPIEFLPSAPLPPQPSSARNKAANAIRTTMMEILDISNLYDLDRFHLDVQSTIDVPLQNKVTDFLHSLNDPDVVSALGLNGARLLQGKDPKKVVYSFLLVEPTPEGNWVRVQADSLLGPLDFNKSVKVELGSTAKLRTLTHYLEVVAELHKELSLLGDEALKKAGGAAWDPISQWAVETFRKEKNIALEPFLESAMERHYSANPREGFFTGGGLHHFENFDSQDDRRIPPLREAFRNSTNLVFIRLMRDLVSYHRARLSYSSDAVLSDPKHPDRQRMLREVAEEESKTGLRRAFQAYRGLTPDEIVTRVAGRKTASDRRLTILFFAWGVGADEKALAAWLEKNQAPTTEQTVTRLFRAYHNRRLTLADYGYLLAVHPLDLWCAGELRKNPSSSWDDLFARSVEARRTGSAWLLNPHNKHAQDLRLRIHIEKEAFARMTPYWQRLGFPFKTMVPSYATAIGNSSDRPLALAELMGILLNEGVRRRATSLKQFHFARGTPYETLFEPTLDRGARVLAPEVTHVVKKALADVVEQGTARRLKGAFTLSDGTPIVVGGKTGSGDNRFETFNRQGGVTSSRATNRTAALVFYIGERYFGVVTAYVEGREAGDYRFTSALPVTLLKILAPTLIEKFDKSTKPTPPASSQPDRPPRSGFRF